MSEGGPERPRRSKRESMRRLADLRFPSTAVVRAHSMRVHDGQGELPGRHPVREQVPTYWIKGESPSVELRGVGHREHCICLL